MNKKDGQFKDLVTTCNNSPGCGYIVRDAKGGHGNLYKICETKANKGMDVWKRPGGPAGIPESHKIGGMITYEKMANKNTYNDCLIEESLGHKLISVEPDLVVDCCSQFPRLIIREDLVDIFYSATEQFVEAGRHPNVTSRSREGSPRCDFRSREDV